MKILRMNDEQARVVEDILAGALEDIECDASDDPRDDAYHHDCARKVRLLRPVVDAFHKAFCGAAEGKHTSLLDAITDEERS